MEAIEANSGVFDRLKRGRVHLTAEAFRHGRAGVINQHHQDVRCIVWKPLGLGQWAVRRILHRRTSLASRWLGGEGQDRPIDSLTGCHKCEGSGVSTVPPLLTALFLSAFGWQVRCAQTGSKTIATRWLILARFHLGFRQKLVDTLWRSGHDFESRSTEQSQKLF